MTTYRKTFTPVGSIKYTEAFTIGDANDHTFVVKVADVDTSVDYNFQISMDGVNWANLAASNIQKTANGSYVHTYSGYHGMQVRGAYAAEVGGVKATVTVGTVVFTMVKAGTEFNSYTIETVLGGAPGAETVSVLGLTITVTANAGSTLQQIQDAIAANAEAAALITADAIGAFAADGPSPFMLGTGCVLTFDYKGGE